MWESVKTSAISESTWQWEPIPLLESTPTLELFRVEKPPSQNPGSSVLDERQLSNGLLWKAGEEAITIIHPAGDKGMNKFLQVLTRNKTSNSCNVFEMIVCWFSYCFDRTTKTKVCLQNHPKIFDLIFSCLTSRVKVCIHLENFIFWISGPAGIVGGGEWITTTILRIPRLRWDTWARHRTPSCPLLQVYVHFCVCALGWVKCKAQIPSMGYHTWPHTTSLSPSIAVIGNLVLSHYLT